MAALVNGKSISPHGGKLVSLLIEGKEREKKLDKAASLLQIRLSSKETSDLVMLGIGAFSPLTGFMLEKDYRSVIESMHLANDILWPIPITLAIPKDKASSLKDGQQVALVDEESSTIMGIIEVQEIYGANKEAEAFSVYGTSEEKHPGVRKLFQNDSVYLGGPVTALSEGEYLQKYPEYARPRETRELFLQKGWKTVAAFQTRNPLHRSHEYITKVVLEIVDGLLIHPIVGKLKAGDIPAEVRMRCYKALLEKYYPAARITCKVYPMEMRYAGPKEAVLHAIIRQNFGCTHLIVGRDHAGVGSYYGTYDAQRIFTRLSKKDLQIKIINIESTFYCNQCQQMASKKTCPHSDENHLLISGTQLRKMLSEGKTPPENFSRPEVLKILQEYYTKEKLAE